MTAASGYEHRLGRARKVGASPFTATAYTTRPSVVPGLEATSAHLIETMLVMLIGLQPSQTRHFNSC
jgi:hypothetical protein